VSDLHASSDATLGVVYLVWAPLGPGPVRAFLRSYRKHPAGIPHELVILLNGAQIVGSAGSVRPTHDASAQQAGRAHEASTRQAGPALSGPLTRETLAGELRGVEHRLIELERPLLDLAAYGEAARRLGHEQLCFLNSYSVVLADGWLAHLAHAIASPEIGLVGATGSWESRAKLIQGSAMHWAYQLAKLPEKLHDFPGFPNPHIRTTAFLLDRALALELGLERARDKRGAYRLESGRQGITRQVQARGLRAVVVGRDGRSYDVHDWPGSRTFRAGEQSNLLVADNRTGEWQLASPAMRRCLSHYAWGDADLPS
jgi:hypothetical protein